MRTSLFNFFDLFRPVIGDAKRQPRLSDDVQLVSIVQDLIPRGGGGAAGWVVGYEAPTPAVAEFGARFAIAAVAAEVATVAILAVGTGGGIWVMPATAENTMSARLYTQAALPGLGSTLNATAANATSFGAGGAATAIVEFGTQVSADPANAMGINPGATRVGGQQNLVLQPIFIGPGRVFMYESTAANAQADQVLTWREVA